MTTLQPEFPASPRVTRVTARALLLGDRIEAAGLERSDMISSTPLAFHAGANGFVALYRFGVAVMVGLSPLEEDDVLKQVKLRVSGPHEHIDDESAILEISPDLDDKVPPGGAIAMKDLSAQRLLVVADALAKSVSLGRDEREVNAVFDIIEPFATELARHGRPPWKRRSMLRLIGQTLLVQHRVSGRVAVEEKPDVLWDRPDLERLYARLEDEYELKERAETLKRKLDTIVETRAHAHRYDRRQPGDKARSDDRALDHRRNSAYPRSDYFLAALRPVHSAKASVSASSGVTHRNEAS